MALRQHLRFSTTFCARARGLLGTDRSYLGEDALLLAPCRSVHTLGMRYPIDVAFISKAGFVLSVHRSVSPGRFCLSHRNAWAAVERAAAQGSWLDAGAEVVIDLSVTDANFPTVELTTH